MAAVCHARNVPLIVDEAHGGHFCFMPGVAPKSALESGADLAVQSCHKTLGSLVGSAQLHVSKNSLVPADEVQHALNFLQTTSPSLLLLASLDVQRRWLARNGRALFAEAAAAARSLREEINAINGMRVFGVEGDARLAGHLVDPLRLVVNVTETGWDGYEVERFLRTEFKIEDEMADQFSVVYILSPHDDEAATRRLVEGLKAVSKSPKTGAGTPRLAGKVDSHLLQPPIPPLAMAPREAALAKQTMVRREDAAGRTCAEMVMFYPPGIPLLMPGEVVTRETLDVCQKLLAAGANPYASDPTFETICVVK